MAPEVRRLFGTRGSVTEPTQTERDRSGGEAEHPDLVEVYVGARDVHRAAFVFESYTPPDALQDDTATISWEFVWVGLGSLMLFAGATVSMAVSAARRVDRSQQRRSEFLRQALRSSRHERRRHAQEVDDDVIQDLSAVGYPLPTILGRLPPGPESDEARWRGRLVSDLMVAGATQLPGLAADLLPPDLGWEAALC